MRRSRSLLISLVFVCGLVTPLVAQQSPPPFRPPFTVDSLWTQLMKGNDLYAKKGELSYTELKHARRATADEQTPPVTVLSCSDSRVSPELVFHRGVGELFVVRAAGNVADTFGIASIEYAIAHHWTKVIVVLSHGHCGAVTAALEKKDPDTPSLLALVTRIRESFSGIEPGQEENDRLRAAIVANAKASADYLIAHSTVIGDAVRNNTVHIVVAYAHLGSGEVERIPYKPKV